MWLPVLICLAAVSLIIGPILLMQPSPAERRLALLRERALAEGLRVHLQSPPAEVSLPANVKFAAMYCLPYKDSVDAKKIWLLVKKSYTHELHVAGFWDWQKEPLELQWHRFAPLLESVPKGVFAIGSGPQGLCCYWLEQGNVDSVKAMADWLKATCAALKID